MAAPSNNLDMDLTGRKVVAYFADIPSKLYQLQMWLPVFESLPEELRPVVLLRSRSAFHRLLGETELDLVLAPKLDNVMRFYERSSFEAVIYVNNSRSNFQSLMFQSAAHIHVNHGESDKISMVSNQAKAYDRVFVAGQAAVDRYLSAVAWLDPSHLVPVGRPQLDFVERDTSWPDGRQVLLYAPTWQGEDDANNYTSVDIMGPAIISAMLSVPNSQVVYKPHPRVVTSRTGEVQAGHTEIMELLAEAPNGQAQLTGDILPLLARADLLVADVSSVGLDYLYIRPDRPQVLCDRRSDPDELMLIAPISRVAMRLDQENITDLAGEMPRLMSDNPHAEAMAELREYYFGDLAPGQSTERFTESLVTIMAEHTTAVRSLTRGRGLGSRQSTG